jgi:rhodanese-related sulfurtransferase
MRNQSAICSLIFVSLMLPACGQMTFEEKLDQLYNLSVPQVKAEKLATNADVLILDIRSEKEYMVSHLKGARHINYDTFSTSDVDDIDKSKEIVVYCSVGYRSEKIGEKLLEMGFSNVLNLYGGIFDWKNKGYEVFDQNGQPTDSVHTYNEKWSKWLIKGIKVYE